MTDKQRAAFTGLLGNIWEVGWSYGYEGADVPAMLTSLGTEIGGAPPDWMMPKLLEGHGAGLADRDEMAKWAATGPASASTGEPNDLPL